MVFFFTLFLLGGYLTLNVLADIFISLWEFLAIHFIFKHSSDSLSPPCLGL